MSPDVYQMIYMMPRFIVSISYPPTRLTASFGQATIGEQTANLMSALPIFPEPSFPESKKPRLGGIPRLAAEGESIRGGHDGESFPLPAKSLLNRCVSKRAMPFTWTINPYRG